MDALKRAWEMMMMPQNQLPPLSLKYYKHLEQKNGCCGEVFLTAFAIYAQCVENLLCNDSLYMASEIDRQWFRDNDNAIPKEIKYNDSEARDIDLE